MTFTYVAGYQCAEFTVFAFKLWQIHWQADRKRKSRNESKRNIPEKREKGGKGGKEREKDNNDLLCFKFVQ